MTRALSLPGESASRLQFVGTGLLRQILLRQTLLPQAFDDEGAEARIFIADGLGRLLRR